MNKLAIITGASRGIGLAVANYLANKNYDLVLIARNSERLEQVASDIQSTNSAITVTSHAVDVSNAQAAYDQLKSMVSDIAQVDLLFNSAGILYTGSDDMAIDDLDALLQTNVLGLFAVAKAVLEKMSDQDSGYVMNLSSMSGRRAFGGNGGYATSKFAVSGLTESLFKKYVKQGIKVTALCPSYIDTDMTQHMSVDNADKITVEDIVKTVDYLLSLGNNAAVPFIEIHCVKHV